MVPKGLDYNRSYAIFTDMASQASFGSGSGVNPGLAGRVLNSLRGGAEQLLVNAIYAYVSAFLGVSALGINNLPLLSPDDQGIRIETELRVFDEYERVRFVKVEVTAQHVNSLRIDAEFAQEVSISVDTSRECRVWLTSPPDQKKRLTLQDTSACEWRTGSTVYLRFNSSDPNRLRSLAASAMGMFGPVQAIYRLDVSRAPIIINVSVAVALVAFLGFGRYYRKKKRLGDQGRT